MLYEPTNIIPSTATNTGTISATDDIKIQWQVNGNSAMSMFQIDVMQNNAESTFVYSTGIISQNDRLPSPSSQLPFYGKDRFGNYVPFNYVPNETWATISENAIKNGNLYKLSITQFFSSAEYATTISISSSQSLSIGQTYYFSIYYIPLGGTRYVSFTVTDASLFTSEVNIYYNFDIKTGWVHLSNGRFAVITCTQSQSQPSSGTNLGEANVVIHGEDFYQTGFVQQNVSASVVTRNAPTLEINTINNTDVSASTDVSVSSARIEATAIYSQDQGDSIKWVRWQLKSIDGLSPEVNDDTGEVITGVLEYEYDGLYNGSDGQARKYSLTCTIETENDIQTSAQINLSVLYERILYDGNFTAQPICTNDCNLLSWDAMQSIPGVATPEDGYTLSNGQIQIGSGTNIVWNTVVGTDGISEAMNFSAPWTFTWRTYLQKPTIPYVDTILSSNQIYGIEFSPNGDYLVLAGHVSTNYGASIYSVSSAGVITKKSDVSVESAFTYSCAFHPSGNYFALCGSNGSNNIYSFSSDGVAQYVSSFDFTTTYSLSGNIALCPNTTNGEWLLVCGMRESYVDCIGIYSFSDGTATFQRYVQYNGANGFPIAVLGITFSPDGKYLVIRIDGAPYGLVYTFENGHATFLQNLSQAQGYALNGALRCAEFSPNGKYLFIGGEFRTEYGYNNYGAFYSVSVSGEFKWERYISAQNGTGLSAPVWSISFSPNGSYVVVAGEFEEYCYLYAFSNDTLLYLCSLENQSGNLTSSVRYSSFSPASNVLVLKSGSEISEWELDVVDGVFCDINGQSIEFGLNGLTAVLSMNSVEVCRCELPVLRTGDLSNELLIFALTPTTLYIFVYDKQAPTEIDYGVIQQDISYTQPQVNEVRLFGEQICDYIALVDGNGDNFISFLYDESFVPQWTNNSGYTLDLFADFTNSIEGGTGTASGRGFSLYRMELDGEREVSYRRLLQTNDTLKLKDYGIKSGNNYIYYLYAYASNGAFTTAVSTDEQPTQHRFKRFSLLSTQYKESDNCYHVVKEYQFSCNIQDMTVSNNSNKSYVQNFTPYPTVFQSTANYSSGTLQALIGFVDPKSYKYWDSTQLMDELNALSTTTNTLFLKDMKGHLWMVDVGTVQMTATQKTREMQVTISLPWTEIGDASDVSIIQTPDDEGWDYGEQVLDVKLDVDVNTGLLYVTYPFPYNGTAFYLVGTNPVGSENIVQPLPETASSPQDGILNAKVKK